MESLRGDVRPSYLYVWPLNPCRRRPLAGGVATGQRAAPIPLLQEALSAPVINALAVQSKPLHWHTPILPSALHCSGGSSIAALALEHTTG